LTITIAAAVERRSPSAVAALAFAAGSRSGMPTGSFGGLPAAAGSGSVLAAAPVASLGAGFIT
jgi:hypothetical protein